MSIASRFFTVLGRLFPSVPPADQARVLAAMEGRSTNPVSGRCGEAAPETGQTPESEVADSTSHTSPSGPPAVELCMSEPIHPGLRYRLTDHALAAALGCWAIEEEQQ